MPTLHFYGWPEKGRDATVEQARRRLSALPYRSEIVFVLEPDSTVRSWDGEPAPFIRVLSRSPERIQAISDRLADLADVESAVIDFHRRVPTHST